MNPAIEALAKVISSEALVQIKCEHEQRDYLSLELQVQLDLFAALMFHGVVSESPEEVADILVSDFRNTIQGRFGKPRIPGLEKDIKQIFVKICRAFPSRQSRSCKRPWASQPTG